MIVLLPDGVMLGQYDIVKESQGIGCVVDEQLHGSDVIQGQRCDRLPPVCQCDGHAGTPFHAWLQVLNRVWRQRTSQQNFCLAPSKCLHGDIVA
jgi:hypothetical protein